ncbi:hypothetical protein OTU49_015443, partial [Cherax quadricarinatus]
MITNIKRAKMEDPLSVGGDRRNVKELVDNNNNASNNNTSGEGVVSATARCDTSSCGATSRCVDATIRCNGAAPGCNDAIRCDANPVGGSGGKYQLRPRSLQSRRRSDSEWCLQDSLRHKPRPPPLSRYRRKTANARERYRMRQINTAFESLRGVLPSWVCSSRAASDMTKITTLRLASAYIRSLQDILDGKAHQDTCSWILSSILGETPKQTQISQYTAIPDKIQQPPAYVNQESDYVSLLCNPPTSDMYHDNLESFSYLSPMSETEAMALLLGSD